MPDRSPIQATLGAPTAAAAAGPNWKLSVMADRRSADEGLDFFPTWPWATRALCEHVLLPLLPPREMVVRHPPGMTVADLRWPQTVWEPAAGQGHMARPLAEYFASVIASDVHDYGAGYPICDFLTSAPPRAAAPDWIITNPPFNRFGAFAWRALARARAGVALLGRLQVLEGVARHRELFSRFPPAVVAPFVERVPMAAGRLGDSTATAYCWIIWTLPAPADGQTRLRWIPPCRSQLTRAGDEARS